MSDLQNKLDKVISDIEKRLTNKEDFEYVKTQIYNIYTIFLDEFDKLEAKCNEKMEDISNEYIFIESISGRKVENVYFT